MGAVAIPHDGSNIDWLRTRRQNQSKTAKNEHKGNVEAHELLLKMVLVHVRGTKAGVGAEEGNNPGKRASGICCCSYLGISGLSWRWQDHQ